MASLSPRTNKKTGVGSYYPLYFFIILASFIFITNAKSIGQKRECQTDPTLTRLHEDDGIWRPKFCLGRLKISMMNATKPEASSANRLLLLVEAVRQRRGPIVKFLLTTLLVDQTKLLAPLILATFRLGYFDMFDLLLLKIGPRNVLNGNIASRLLLQASCKGQPAIVGVLLKHGATISAGNIGRNNELMCAVKNRHSATAMVLLNQIGRNSSNGTNAYLERTGKEALLALSLENWRSFFKVFAKLLQLGVSANSKISKANGDPALNYAIKMNASASKVIEPLLRYGAVLTATAPSDGGNTALHVACRNNLVDVVDLLLRKGANVRAQNSELFMPIHVAVRSDASPAVIKLLLDNGTFVDAKHGFGYTPLLLATDAMRARSASASSVETIRLLLARGANTSYSLSEDGATPLLSAAEASSNHPSSAAVLNVFRLLLDHGADVNARDLANRSALIYARNSSYEVTELLVSRGADTNLRTLISEATALTLAVDRRSLDKVRLLVERGGANVNLMTSRGRTPVMLALGNVGTLEILTYLLDHGADVNARSWPDEKTPIIYVAQPPLPDSIVEQYARSLLGHGADVNAATTTGFTALMTAVTESRIGLVAILLDNGANVNAAAWGRNGVPWITALYYARRDAQMLRLLLQRGADPDVRDPTNATLLISATAYNYSFEIIETLLQHGASANAANSVGNTPLMWAVNYNRKDIVEHLLKYGAGINAVDVYGNTALMNATSLEIVELLVQYGANVSMKNKKGFTALMYIVNSSLNSNLTRSIVNLFLQSGGNMSVETAIFDQWEDRFVPSTQTDISNNTSGGKVSVLYSTSVASSKIHNLSILAMLPLLLSNTNSNISSSVGRYADYQRCVVEALQYLLDEVNRNPNILPSYSLQLVHIDYADEPYAVTPTRWVLRLEDLVVAAMSPPQQKRNGLVSPVVLGPNFHCNDASDTNFGKAYRAQQRHLQLSNVYSVTCLKAATTTPYFYSYKDKVLEPDQLAAVTLMSFFKSTQFTFKWKQIGLIANSENQRSLSELTNYHKWLSLNDVHVVDIQIGNNYYEMFTAIRRGRARILLLAQVSSSTDDETCRAILCASNRAGLSPDRYVLLMVTPCILIAEQVPSIGEIIDANCSLSIQRQQKSMIFTSLQQLAEKQTLSAGIKETQFRMLTFNSDRQEAALKEKCPQMNQQESQLMSNIIAGNKMFSYTVYLLHNVEERLRQMYKTSLLALLGGNRKDLVQNVTTQIAAEGDLFGANSRGSRWHEATRTYIIVQANFEYSKANPDRWFDGGERRVVATIWPMTTGGDDIDVKFAGHAITPAQSIIWATKNGLPPKDLSNILQINASYHETAFLIVLTLAGFIFMSQVAIAVGAFRAKRRPKFVTFDFANNSIILLGCFSFNLSAVTLLTGSEFYPNAMCYYRLLFTVLGVTLVNGSFLARMLTMPAIADENRYISRKFRKPNVFNEAAHEQQRAKNVAKLERKTTKIIGWVTASTLAMLGLWFASDPMLLKTSIEHEDDPLFDHLLDTFYTYRLEWCYSESQLYWIVIFSTTHGWLFTLAACILATMVLKRKLKLLRRRWKPEVIRLRVAINNALTILLFVSLLMLVVPSKPAPLWYLKTLLFAVAELLYSASTSAIIFKPIWSPLLHPKRLLAKWRGAMLLNRRKTKSRSNKINNNVMSESVHNNIPGHEHEGSQTGVFGCEGVEPMAPIMISDPTLPS